MNELFNEHQQTIAVVLGLVSLFLGIRGWPWKSRGKWINKENIDRVSQVATWSQRDEIAKAYVAAEAARREYVLATGDRTDWSMLTGTPAKDNVRALWTEFFDLYEQWKEDNHPPAGYVWMITPEGPVLANGCPRQHTGWELP